VRPHRKATFSIVAVDGPELGCAVQSRYFAVGSVVPWAKAGVGAVATQAAGVAVYGPQTLALLEGGLGPDAALEQVLAGDPARESRQLGAVAPDGSSASFTGAQPSRSTSQLSRSPTNRNRSRNCAGTSNVTAIASRVSRSTRAIGNGWNLLTAKRQCALK